MHILPGVSIVAEGPALGKTIVTFAVPAASPGLLALWKLVGREFPW